MTDLSCWLRGLVFCKNYSSSSKRQKKTEKDKRDKPKTLLIQNPAEATPVLLVPNFHIKSMCFRLSGAYLGRGRSKSYKRLCARMLLQVQCAWQTYSRNYRTSCVGSVPCGWKKLWAWILWNSWHLDKKSGNLVEWDAFRWFWIVAFNYQEKWQKHSTEILNCDRQSYGAAKPI